MCQRYASCNVYNISPGEWLRDLAEHSSRSDLGDYVTHNWSHETLTPLVTDYLDNVIGTMLTNFGKDDFLVVVDGFPRSASEARAIPHICRGHEFVIVELDPCEETLRQRGEQRKRGNDDTEGAIDIRLESYRQNHEKIAEELAGLHCKIEHLRTEAGEDAVHAAVVALVQSGHMQRLPIPSQPPKKTLARKLFHEAGAIDSACIIQKSLRLAQSTRLRRQFYGTHPISFTRENMARIRRYPYLVALKAAGVRFLCLVCGEHLWFISRGMEVFQGPHITGLKSFEGTLVDGELIGLEDAAYYVVLDCIAANGKNCMRHPIIDRLRASVQLGQFMYNGPLHFRLQEYMDRGMLPELLRKRAAAPWKIDGIILQPAKLPYRLGIDYNMFKWKPFDQNTGDFYFHAADSGLYCRMSPPDTTKDIDQSPRPIDVSNAPMLVANKIKMVKFGKLLPIFHPKWLQDGMIIECGALSAENVEKIGRKNLGVEWSANELVWIPQQHRGDKPCPNIDWVMQSVVQSIIDDITEQELVDLCIGGQLRGDSAILGGGSKNKKRRALY